jgi:bifunctional DNA-binding transcriptional regulator/antitoxin component of YhaV-PrlF toxin-antitoxin module
MSGVVKHRRKGHTRVSPKHQVTLPVDVLSGAGFRSGDELRVQVTAPGTVTLTRVEDALDRYAGTLTGVFPPDAIDRLRDEWE